MKDTMIVMQNESLAMRVMELEAELEILILKQKENKPSPKLLQSNNLEVQDLKKKLADANEKYRNVTLQYSILKKNNSFPVEVRGLRKIAYVYARYGIKGIIKKMWLRVRRK